MVNNRIACFLTCGYTEAGAMQFFLKRVNDKFEYKQYLPNRTIKKKGDPKIINKEISGLTGEKLLEKVYTILDKDISCVNFFFYIIKAGIISVCDDCLAFFLEFFQIIDYFGAVEGFAIL